MMLLGVRPDITYRTGVLQPIGGFSPHHDIMATVNEFTLGPQGFQRGGLSGSFSLSSWWTNLKLRFQAWRARRAGLGFAPYGPKAWAGGRAVPYASGREAMLIAMGQRNMPPQFSAVNPALIQARFR